MTATERNILSGVCSEVTGVRKFKLFDKVCCEELSLKKNVVVFHVSSAKHKAGKDQVASKGCKVVKGWRHNLPSWGDFTFPILSNLCC